MSVPDEQSNLNPAPAARRPDSRRRGRRGGRGRRPGPRPPAANAPTTAGAGEISHAPAAADVDEATEIENENAPLPAMPGTEAERPDSARERVENVRPAPQRLVPQRPERPDRPERNDRLERPERFERPPAPEQRAPRPRYPDFRPADASAISQAVEHATEIADGLKKMIDHLDEVLELVEVAERQKLADEREIDELRRALRRIQPPRQPQTFRPPRHDEPQRGPREQTSHHSESPHQKESDSHHETPSSQSEPEPHHEESHGEPDPDQPRRLE